MKKGLLIISILFCSIGFTQSPNEIIDKVDFNMTSDTKIMESDMIIHGRRNSRTISSRGFSRGKHDSYTEYLAPEREKGTKMLKLEDYLWIYSPSSDRTIQLSGHMLRQSVMGSDLSYEDMMDDRKLTEVYDAVISSEEVLEKREVWVLKLVAKVDDATYNSRKIWVDKERFVPLQEELFAKSGQLLKKTVLSDVQEIDGRWYPMKINYKDMLKDGKGTDFVITKLEIDPEIPDHIFTKSSLKK